MNEKLSLRFIVLVKRHKRFSICSTHMFLTVCLSIYQCNVIRTPTPLQTATKWRLEDFNHPGNGEESGSSNQAKSQALHEENGKGYENVRRIHAKSSEELPQTKASRTPECSPTHSSNKEVRVQRCKTMLPRVNILFSDERLFTIEAVFNQQNNLILASSVSAFQSDN